MRRPILLGVVTLAVTCYAIPAHAEISDELADELQGYVEESLSEGDAAAKRAALLTWGYVADDEGRESIAEYKSAEQGPVRLAAGLALWRAGDEEAESFVSEQLKGRASLFSVLQSELSVVSDSREGEILRHLVEEGEQSHRDAAFRYLSRQTGDLYGMLGDYIAASDSSLRGGALDAVRAMPRKAALDFVEADMLGASDSSLQVDGVELAIHISTFPGRVSAAKSLLEGALEHENPDVVEKAGVRLVELEESAAVEPLVELMATSVDLARKKRIARALLEHGASLSALPAERIGTLYKESQMALKSDDGEDGSGGGGGSDGSGDGSNSDDEPVDEELSDLYLRLAAAAGSEGVFKKLEHMFGTTRFEKRVRAAKALGYAGQSDAVDMLGKALFEGSDEMRLAAATSLRQTRSEAALPSLKRAISQERNQKIKVQIIRALGAIGNERALRILRFNSKTQKSEIRKAVIAAVRDAGAKRGFETLRLYLSSRDLEIQWEAFLAALEIAPEEAMKRVDEIFRNPQDNFMRDLRQLSAERQELILPELLTHDTRRVRTEAFRGARRIGSRMYGLFREIAFDSEAPDDIRRRCLRTLATVRADEDRSKFEQLARNADNLEFRKLALWTLAEYGSSELEATFRGFVTSDSPLIKALGAYGLARISAEA